MTVDEAIAQLTALRTADPAVGGYPLVVEQWYAVLSRGPAITAEYADVIRTYVSGHDVRVVALKGP